MEYFTVKTLKEELEKLIEEGKGNYKVTFDNYVYVNRIDIFEEDKSIDLV